MAIMRALCVRSWLSPCRVSVVLADIGAALLSQSHYWLFVAASIRKKRALREYFCKVAVLEEKLDMSSFFTD